jgi:hypothetical protein
MCNDVKVFPLDQFAVRFKVLSLSHSSFNCFDFDMGDVLKKFPLLLERGT